MSDRASSIVDRFLSWTAASAAVVVAISFAHREFMSPPQGQRPAVKSEYVRGWRDIATTGRRDGSAAAPITIVEFMDLQCPFCKSFNEAVHALKQRYPKEVATVFVHFPIPSHRFASTAAKAVECADVEGRASPMVDALYARQDSIGTSPWASYASVAGVRDTIGFKKCLNDTTAVPAIARGVTTGHSIRVNATPTVILNGWRYGQPPSDTELTRAVSDLLAGRKPYSGYPSTP